MPIVLANFWSSWSRFSCRAQSFWIVGVFIGVLSESFSDLVLSVLTGGEFLWEAFVLHCTGNLRPRGHQESFAASPGRRCRQEPGRNEDPRLHQHLPHGWPRCGQVAAPVLHRQTGAKISVSLERTTSFFSIVCWWTGGPQSVACCMIIGGTLALILSSLINLCRKDNRMIG